MDIIVEIILELYMGFMMLIVPEKNIGKKHRVIATILAVCMLVIVLGLGVWGLIWLEESNLYGIIPLSIAILLSLIQIIAGIVLYNKHH